MDTDSIAELLDRLVMNFSKADLWRLEALLSPEMERIAARVSTRADWGGAIDAEELLSEAKAELFSEFSMRKLSKWTEARERFDHDERDASKSKGSLEELGLRFATAFLSSAVYRVHKRIVRERQGKTNESDVFRLHMAQQKGDAGNSGSQENVLVQEALASLSEDDQSILRLRYVEELSLRDISTQENIQYAAACQRVKRATLRLKKALQKLGVHN